jgi:hypothetical protein
LSLHSRKKKNFLSKLYEALGNASTGWGRGEKFSYNNHISRIVLIKKFFIRNNLAHKYKTCTAAAHYERSTFSCSLHNIPLSLSPIV